MGFISWKCKACEKKELKNPKNTYPTRKLMRKHLREVHGLKHELPKLGGYGRHKLGASCRCLSQMEENGKDFKNYERIVVE